MPLWPALSWITLKFETECVDLQISQNLELVMDPAEFIMFWGVGRRGEGRGEEVEDKGGEGLCEVEG